MTTVKKILSQDTIMAIISWDTIMAIISWDTIMAINPGINEDIWEEFNEFVYDIENQVLTLKSSKIMKNSNCAV